MRNVERRALIGLEPFGDPALDNSVWMPNTLVLVATAPDENGNPVSIAAFGRTGVDAANQTPPDPNAPPPSAAMPAAMMPAKAALPPSAAKLHASLTRLRARVDREHTPVLRAALHGFLAAQRQDIATRLRTNAAHIAAKPTDHDTWFARKRWDRELTGILARPLTAMAQNVNEHIGKAMPVKAMPVSAVDRALARGAARVTDINERTRRAVQAYLVAGIAEGASPADLADSIETGVLLDNGQPAFDELRAETIARTEITDAYNGAALASYADAGASEVQAIDGDGDEECAARDGQVFSVEEAAGIEDHPNGTLDWVPIIADLPVEEPVAKADLQHRELLAAMERPITVTNYITTPEVVIPASEPPVVNIAKGAVQVNLPEQKAKRIERDERGQVVRIVEE